ncbi:MAG: Asp-tRNA(Asn)/Glu-tRNA(Gln) amidotransferase subunit GatC [Anaerovoracaceae bacterium]|jgi:aspartyl-tRNA(Asn)/glutamyl-tRNA(Gln) amidotransferase subunit C
MIMNVHTVEILESMTKLKLCKEDKERALERMKALTDSLKSFEAIDTDGVEPLIRVNSIDSKLREDVVEKTISRNELLINAPEKNRCYYQVPGALD